MVWTTEPSKRGASERVTGVCLVAAIALSRWAENGNMFEVIRGNAVLLVNLYCYMEGYSINNKKVYHFIGVLRKYLFGNIAEFSQFIVGRGSVPLIFSSPLFEFGYYHQRKMLIFECLAIDLIERLRTAKGDNRNANSPTSLGARLISRFWTGCIHCSCRIGVCVGQRDCRIYLKGGQLVTEYASRILAANAEENPELNTFRPHTIRWGGWFGPRTENLRGCVVSSTGYGRTSSIKLGLQRRSSIWSRGEIGRKRARRCGLS